MDAIDNLLHGSIDMHVHMGPDAHIERCVDGWQAAAQAEAAGMRAIVLKSHDYSTAPLAGTIGPHFPGISLIGSLCLDFATGGLNLEAVKVSAELGARIVWMPTFSAAFDMKKRGVAPELVKMLGGGITITDGHGKILPVVTGILEVIKQHDMAVATGHVSFGEIVALVNECRRLGIDQIVVTHALEPRFGATLTLGQQKQLTASGACIEHTYLSALPSGGKIGIKALVDGIKAVGPEHSLVSTDLGQKENVPPAEGMRACIAALLEGGLSEADITLMVKTNPARLLGLG